MRDTIALGVRNGVSVARIQLSPASLGSIQINLQRTSNGLIARVVTEHPEAAQTLSQNGDDLRRSLQQNGTQLLRLDIESSDQRGSSAEQQAETTGARSVTGDEDVDGEADAPASSTELPTQTLPGASLVNVLA